MERGLKYYCRPMPSILCIILILISSPLVFAGPIDTIQLLKISPRDERAIVKMEDGSMKIIKPGDSIGKSGKIIEITTGRVIIEEQTERGMETVIIRLIEGRQTVERLRRTPDTRPEMFKPQ